MVLRLAEMIAPMVKYSLCLEREYPFAIPISRVRTQPKSAPRRPNGGGGRAPRLAAEVGF